MRIADFQLPIVNLETSGGCDKKSAIGNRQLAMEAYGSFS